jgi:hypothetical protein
MKLGKMEKKESGTVAGALHRAWIDTKVGLGAGDKSILESVIRPLRRSYDHQSPTKGNTGKPCRLFERGECKLHFSATTGTLFHDSHLPLQKWFMEMALMGEANKGISANRVARHIGVQHKTAEDRWRELSHS